MNDLKFSILVRGWGNLTEHFVGERARFQCFRWCVVVGIGCGVGSFFQGCRPSAAPRVEVVEEIPAKPEEIPVVSAVVPPPVKEVKEVDAQGEANRARVKSRMEAVRAVELARPAIHRGDFGGAAAVLSQWLEGHPEHGDRGIVERQMKREKKAGEVVPGLLARPALLIGAAIPVGKATWVVSGVADGRLMCRVQAQFGVIERPLEIASLGEAGLMALIVRADRVDRTALARGYLLAMGKSKEAREATVGSDDGAEKFRKEVDEYEQVVSEAFLLNQLDGLGSLIDRRDYAGAGARLAEIEKSDSGHEFLTVAYREKLGEWKLQVAEAERMEGKPQPRPVIATGGDTYPGVGAINLSAAVAAGDPERKQLLQAARWAGMNGNWERHLKQLKAVIVGAVENGGWQQRPMNLEKLIGVGTPNLVAEQARFILAVRPDALNRFSKLEKSGDFLEWLFARPAILGVFNDTIEAEDKAETVLAGWSAIWFDDEENREKLASLAMACALVFDRPMRISPEVFGSSKTTESGGASSGGAAAEVSALGRYRFYRDSAKRGGLKTNLSEMLPWELVWVVGAPVPESELIWAQKHLDYGRRDWGKAYAHIRYRMDRATQGVNPYKAYTLAEIEKEGGICGDQAYFAAISAQANGIPAMVISGEGDRGGHAWMGYELGRSEWKLDTGRYADNFAAGTTENPQTGKRMKEHELRQWTDPARRTKAYEKSTKLIGLAAILVEAGKGELARLAIDQALVAAPKNFEAWVMKLDQLVLAKAPSVDWLKENARMRTTFREYPDLVQAIDQREANYLGTNVSAEAARKVVHLQTGRMERKDGDRSDLILDSVFREVALAEKAGETEKVGRIFRDALREKGDEVVAFKRIAAGYYGWAKAHDQGPKTVRELMAYFDRTHPEPSTDVFALKAYRAVLGSLKGMAKEQGMESQEHQLERREEKLKATEEKQGKLQSRGAELGR